MKTLAGGGVKQGVAGMSCSRHHPVTRAAHHEPNKERHDDRTTTDRGDGSRRPLDMSADDRLGTAERERLASSLVVRSGRLALEYFHRAHTGSPRDGSSAIEAGRVVQERLVGEIGRAFPDDAILAEEGELSAGPERALYRWVL